MDVMVVITFIVCILMVTNLLNKGRNRDLPMEGFESTKSSPFNLLIFKLMYSDTNLSTCLTA